jgi:hypothetical protein
MLCMCVRVFCVSLACNFMVVLRMGKELVAQKGNYRCVAPCDSLSINSKDGQPFRKASEWPESLMGAWINTYHSH